MPKIVKISGPPGTGKTYYLLKQIENACKKYDPEQIGAVSFSKAAVEEMRSRVTKTLGLYGKATSNIRTIHSHCFKLLGLSKEQVVEEKGSLMREWNEKYPEWSLPSKAMLLELEDEPTEQVDDYLYRDNSSRFQKFQILRNRMIPVERWVEDDIIAMGGSWMAWLTENGYYDYTLMLEECYRLKLCPTISVLFVDEAQDLSALQLAITQLWAEQTDTAIWIGDEDQAIMRFQGATPEVFGALQSDWSNVLKHSYRVPRAVHAYAMRLIEQIGDRRTAVEYLPRDEEGIMDGGHYWPDLSAEGTHAILCRCNYQIKRWTNWLTSKGIPWFNPYRPTSAWNPTETKLWQAVTTYDRLASGLEVGQGDLIDLISTIKAKDNLITGIKSHRKKLVESLPNAMFDVFALSGTGWFEPEFFDFTRYIGDVFSLDGQAGALLDRGGRKIVKDKPRVIVGTYHSVKGGEADHVWVDLSSTATIERAAYESQTARDDECRVSYVAVTRARQSCHLINPAGLGNGVFLRI